MAATARPLPGVELPAPLKATDGLAPGAPPEDVFTWDTITKRMPKIMDSVLESLPTFIREEASFVAKLRELQQEMRDGAALKPLEPTAPWVNAENWNSLLAPFIQRGEGWHTAPWWVVENYMYKRLLQEMARLGPEAAKYDPFETSKRQALEAAVGAMGSVRPLLQLFDEAEAGSTDKRVALKAALIRSLWGNQADLSLSAGKVEASSSGSQNAIVSDHTESALDFLQHVKSRQVIVVLDNHGLEVLCDLVLVDAILRLTDASSVALHVKDAPVFVSDVTSEDIPGILDWLATQDANLARRLRESLASGRLQIVPDAFYTSALTFWELPQHIEKAFSEAAAVILKGDANYRRLLGDLHWPYDTDFQGYVSSFWPKSCLVSLRTMKSGVALGISKEKQQEAIAARPNDWLTCGVYGQVLAAAGRQ